MRLDGAAGGTNTYPSFELNKRMPVGYMKAEDGSRKTLRESLVEGGMELHQELPGPQILYQGRFLDANRVQGTWIIQRNPIRLPNGKTFTPSGGAGYWCAEFVTEKLDANPAGGPGTELFNKSFLTSRELADVEPPPMCCLGEFSAAEVEQLAARLAAAEIYITIAAADANQAEDMPTDGRTCIYVRPEDEAAAREILASPGIRDASGQL